MRDTGMGASQAQVSFTFSLEDHMSYTGPATAFVHSFTGGETGLKPLEWNSKPVCATAGCNSAAQGKSKYCRPHAREARAAWIEKVRSSSVERDVRNANHRELWERALFSARQAHANALPTPMTVVEKVGVSNQNTGRSWYVSEGACGFAQVSVRPANSSFAIWALKNAGFRKAYGGGITFSTNFNGSQSIDRADAAAEAAATVLREAGIKAYASSRLD
jgi:hypothetical protein